MEKMIAYCGLTCHGCPIFIATQNNDDVKRKETAEIIKKTQGYDVKPEDINCDGCLAVTGRKYIGCTFCYIKKCAQEKGIKNCAYCQEYICERLDEFYKAEPSGKSTLDEIRQGL